ncbi:MAG TPA: CPBP family intramembrane glutamic endopeptidase [Gemmataceae bacterium]|nr:CPBP family intramembrane glutamic endopeptidase [Gemmataceae bacterium]
MKNLVELSDKNLLELSHTGLALLILEAAGVLVCAALWLLVPGVRRRLLPMQRERACPWSGAVIWFAFCLMLFIPVMVHQLLLASGLFTAIYGADANMPALAERQALWSTAFGFTATALVIVALLSSAFGVRPAELGLTPVRTAENIVAGYLTWLLCTPLALLLYWVVTLYVTPEIHPLQLAGQQRLLPVEWVAIVFGAVVAAPLLEELLFRGLLLRWQTDRPMGAQLTVAVAALIIALFWGNQKDRDFNPWPAVFVAAMLPGMFLVALLPKRPGETAPEGWTDGSPPVTKQGPLVPRVPGEDAIQERKEGQFTAAPVLGSGVFPRIAAAFTRLRGERHVQDLLAIYSNALLFAAFHSRVWPSPIALFPLSIGLGWLAYRTQSLIGPLVMHALFNGVACMVLFLSQ